MADNKKMFLLGRSSLVKTGRIAGRGRYLLPLPNTGFGPTGLPLDLVAGAFFPRQRILSIL
jgi:hypothetical protein